jgi:peptide/nickel transport system substrate-binding protein
MDKQIKLQRRNLLAGGAAALLPWQRASAQSTSAASSITVATVGDPGSLDPMPFTADLVSEIDQHIHETLYIFDPALHFFPVLASALPDVSADGKRYTIKLRTDARFHDGTTMDAGDVVTSLQRWMRLSPRGRLGGEYVESVVASSPSSVVMTLKRPYAPMLALLAYPNGAAAIMPKRLATAPDPLTEFIGTGPYKLIEYKPDQYIRLAKVPDYYSPPGPANGYAGKRQALIDELRFVPVPNPVTRVDGLLSGQFHFADLLTPEAYARLANQPNVKQGLVNSPNASNMIFNTKAGVLSDTRLRQAIRYAIVPSEMLTAAFGVPSLWRLEGSIYPKGTDWYDPETPGYNVHDPDQAKTLMKEAGYDGKPVRFLVTKQYDYMYKIGQVAQAQLEEVGFKVEVQVMDWATLLQKRTDPTLWEAFIASHSLVADPTLITIMNPTYPGWWDSADKRTALVNFVSESDPAKRVAAWRQIQSNFYRDVPTIKLGEFLQLYGISNKLTDYTPLAWPCFWNVGVTG